MQKKEALNIIIKCAKNYNTNLKNNNLIFIFENKNSGISIDMCINFIETIFYSTNFLHLTGIKYKNNNAGALDFYNNALKGKLSEKNIEITSPLLVELKLNILHNLINIDKSAKFIGNYNNLLKNKLYTEKVVGNISYCFGLVKDKNTNYYYVPNSTIKDNIKNITDDTCNILAILKKDKKEKLYSTITYLKNGVNLNHLFRSQKLLDLIDLENLKFLNQNDIKNVTKLNDYKSKLIKNEPY